MQFTSGAKELGVDVTELEKTWDYATEDFCSKRESDADPASEEIICVKSLQRNGQK